MCETLVINYNTPTKEPVPVIILDLFPFHGINLNGHRKDICDNISNPDLLSDVKSYMKKIKGVEKLFLFGVPYTIWNYLGGYGVGSIYMNSISSKSGPLNHFNNKTVVINIGGQNLSSKAIAIWKGKEKI